MATVAGPELTGMLGTLAWPAEVLEGAGDVIGGGVAAGIAPTAIVFAPTGAAGAIALAGGAAGGSAGAGTEGAVGGRTGTWASIATVLPWPWPWPWPWA